MKYKIVEPVLTFRDDGIDAAGTIAKSADDGVTWEAVERFSLSISKTTSANDIAQAMGLYALQRAQFDATVTQVRIDVEALLASPGYIVDL